MRHALSALSALAALAAVLFMPGSAQAAPAAGHGAGHAAAKPMAKAAAGGSDQRLITSAMSAAPAAVAKRATIVAMDGGKMRTLRTGTNGFTCMPDSPTTPGPDPMCMDANSLAWGQAWMEHKPPPQKVGVMYMLAGGTDASNTDPYAEKPTAQNHWVKTGPHVMVVGDTAMLSQYPTRPDPDTSEPYVMWAGTPYAHLMMPVR